MSRRSSESAPPGRCLRPRCGEVEVLPRELSLMKHVVLRDDGLQELAGGIEDDVVDLPPLFPVRELFRDVRRKNRFLDRVGNAANPPKDPPRVIVVQRSKRFWLPTLHRLQVSLARRNRHVILAFEASRLEDDGGRRSEPVEERQDDLPLAVPKREHVLRREFLVGKMDPPVHKCALCELHSNLAPAPMEQRIKASGEPLNPLEVPAPPSHPAGPGRRSAPSRGPSRRAP